MMIKALRTRLHESLFNCEITLVLWFNVCSAESFAQTHSPLRVHAENPRYFADASVESYRRKHPQHRNHLSRFKP